MQVHLDEVQVVVGLQYRATKHTSVVRTRMRGLERNGGRTGCLTVEGAPGEEGVVDQVVGV